MLIMAAVKWVYTYIDNQKETASFSLRLGIVASLLSKLTQGTFRFHTHLIQYSSLQQTDNAAPFRGLYLYGNSPCDNAYHLHTLETQRSYRVRESCMFQLFASKKDCSAKTFIHIQCEVSKSPYTASTTAHCKASSQRTSIR